MRCHASVTTFLCRQSSARSPHRRNRNSILWHNLFSCRGRILRRDEPSTQKLHPWSCPQTKQSWRWASCGEPASEAGSGICHGPGERADTAQVPHHRPSTGVSPGVIVKGSLFIRHAWSRLLDGCGDCTPASECRHAITECWRSQGSAGI